MTFSTDLPRGAGMKERGPRSALTADEQAEFERMVAFVKAQAQEHSLRRVAARLQMSPTGLSGVLDGAAPYRKTLRKLRSYYNEVLGLDTPPDGAAEAVSLVRRLAADLPEHARDPSVQRLAASVAALYERVDAPFPTWLADLVDLVSAPPDGCAGPNAG